MLGRDPLAPRPRPARGRWSRLAWTTCKDPPASCRLPPPGTQTHVGRGSGDRGPGLTRQAASGWPRPTPEAVFSTLQPPLVPSASGLGSALLPRAQLPAFSVWFPDVSPVRLLLTGLSPHHPGSRAPFVSCWDPDTPCILSCRLCAKNTVTYTHMHRKGREGHTEHC